MNKKKLNRKGFTLAELLVVVAIIGILVAVAVPVFSVQLDKAKEAVDEANVRAIRGQVTVEMMTADKPEELTGIYYVDKAGTITKAPSDGSEPEGLGKDIYSYNVEVTAAKDAEGEGGPTPASVEVTVGTGAASK